MDYKEMEKQEMLKIKGLVNYKQLKGEKLITCLVTEETYKSIEEYAKWASSFPIHIGGAILNMFTNNDECFIDFENEYFRTCDELKDYKLYLTLKEKYEA